MGIELPKGVSIRHHAKRAAAGHLPWGVHIELMVKGERIRAAEFYATENEAVASSAGAVIAMQEMRDAAWKRAEAAAPVVEAPVTDLALPVPDVASDFPDLLGPAAELWMKHVRRHNEASTRRSYAHSLKFITPRIGAWPLANITSNSCLAFYDDLAKTAGMPLKARRRVHACLSALFSWVRVQSGTTLTHNPALGLGDQIRTEHEKHVALRPDPNPMTPDQAKAFLAWIYEHRRAWYSFFLFLHDTGVRIGEACALQWDSVHLDAGTAHIVESISPSQAQDEREAASALHEAKQPITGALLHCYGLKPTKTHRENQWIDLSDDVVTQLRADQGTAREHWFARGRPQPTFVWTTRNGDPRRPDGKAGTVFGEARDALKLKGERGRSFTIHDLRDTFATTHLLLDPDSLGWVSQMLGQPQETTTKERYYRWVEIAKGQRRQLANSIRGKRANVITEGRK